MTRSDHKKVNKESTDNVIPLPPLLSHRMLQKAQETDYIDINCIDPLGRSALLMAIDNENLEMVELLINHNVDTKDALLHAISEEFVEAVEVLLDHEDSKQHHTGGKHVNERQREEGEFASQIRITSSVVPTSSRARPPTDTTSFISIIFLFYRC